MSMAASRLRSDTPRRMVVMGVSGCGKSTVGAELARRLGAAFSDGDDLHPKANVAKMSRGEPLSDDDRWPWLTLVGRSLAGEGTRIVGCSALKRAYRDQIRRAAGGPVTFIHLAGAQAVIAARMAARKDHFMPPSLLASQIAALEPPGSDEDAVTVDIDQPFDALIGAIMARLSAV